MASSVARQALHEPLAASTDQLRILVLSFDSENLVYQALQAAVHLQDDSALEVHDAIVLRRPGAAPADLVATMNPTPVAAAVPASLVGALVGTLVLGPLGLLLGGVLAGGGGALIAKLVDTGIPADVVAQLRGALVPGQYTLALLASDIHPGAMVAFAMRCGTIGRSTIMPCA